MLTFTKNNATKIVSEDNQAFIDLIIADGWSKEEIKKEEINNGKTRKSGGKSDVSVGAE